MYKKFYTGSHKKYVLYHFIDSMTFQQKLTRGQRIISGKTILHTAPHHDDILLGYFAYLMRNFAGNQHHVLYLTCGANGVSDHFLTKNLQTHSAAVAQLTQAEKITLKSTIRKQESEKKWQQIWALQAQSHDLSGTKLDITHFDAQLYQHEDDQLAQTAAGYTSFAAGHAGFAADCARMLYLLQTIKPDILTVLVDEPGTGPRTHHASAELIFAAVDLYRVWWQQQFGMPCKLEIIGYRNVWSTFSLEQASMIFPVSSQVSMQMEQIFRSCFASQLQNLIMQDDGSMLNFAEQMNWIFAEQGRLCSTGPLVLLQEIEQGD